MQAESTTSRGKHKVFTWQPAEFTFTAQRKYKKPCVDVKLSAVFKGPGGSTFRCNGFWDGGASWKIRFSPTAPGSWTFETTCNVADAGPTGQKGSFKALPAAGENALHKHGGILRVSADRRYLTYSDGTPFFWLVDTWWCCPSDLVPIDGSTKPGCASMYKTLVNKRQKQGYTIVHMGFLGQELNKINALKSLPERTQDPSYWQQVDRYMDHANAAGIVPVVGLNFEVDLGAYSLDEYKFLWDYVVARYGAHSITWLVCTEYNKGGDRPGIVAKMMALGAYIKQIDPYRRAMTVHPWGYFGDKREVWEQSWCDFIMVHGGHRGHNKVPPTDMYRKAWEYQPTRPVLESECSYEGILHKTRTATPDDVRRVAYHAIQAGSFGYTYGSHGLWYPTQTPHDKKYRSWGKPTAWWKSMGRLGAAQMTHLRKCYESVEWWKLTPRPGAVQFSGFSGKSSDATRPLAKPEGDAVYLVWFPKPTKPKDSYATTPASLNLVDPAGAGSYQASWFNPRDGSETKLAAGLTAANGVCPLPKRPDQEDWVLKLRRE